VPAELRILTPDDIETYAQGIGDDETRQAIEQALLEDDRVCEGLAWRLTRRSGRTQLTRSDADALRVVSGALWAAGEAYDRIAGQAVEAARARRERPCAVLTVLARRAWMCAASAAELQATFPRCAARGMGSRHAVGPDSVAALKCIDASVLEDLASAYARTRAPAGKVAIARLTQRMRAEIDSLQPLRS